MSIVVAYKHNDVVYLCSDSQVSIGRSKESLFNPHNFRVWKILGTNDCYMGGVGTHSEVGRIKSTGGLIRERDLMLNRVNFNYIVNHVDPKIRDTLIEYKLISSEKPYDDISSEYIVVANNKIYSIEYGSVLESDDFLVVGNGSCEFSSIFKALSDIEDPLERIAKSFKVFSQNNIRFNYPLVLIDTKTSKFTLITESNEIIKEEEDEE